MCKRAAGAALCGAFGIALFALSGCGSERRDDLRGVLALARYSALSPRRITLSEAAAVPYASMAVSLGNGPQNMAVLATDSDGEQLWVVGKKVTIVTTDGGRIQRTVGMDHDMGWTNLTQPQAEGQRTDWRHPHRIRLRMDFPDLSIFGAETVCDERPDGLVTISVLGKSIATLRVRARCQNHDLNWDFQNIFWTDLQNGLVWQSVQYIHPKGDAIHTQIMRPPG